MKAKPHYPITLLSLTICCLLAFSACKTPSGILKKTKYSQKTRQDSILRIMKRVAIWQMDSIKNKGWRHPEDDWTNGTLYTGLIAYAKATNEESVYTFLKQKVGEKLDWRINGDSLRFFADYYCVGQLYCNLYTKYKDPKMIRDLQVLADTLLNRPHTESLEWVNKINRREWAWCDALFMGPPTLGLLSSVTHDQRYLDLSNKLWWKTTAYLYDPEEALFYRDSRFFNKREANGKKVFWSRGNGWVLAGMVRLMETMPENYGDRSRYTKLFTDMSLKIASLQQPDGTWRTSLLDPEAYPSKEMSGTAFYCYALAWGINHQLLEKDRYLPVVIKAWNALAGSINTNGMPGYVQPIGNKAKAVIKPEDTEVYGTGGFLLAGVEMLKLI